MEYLVGVGLAASVGYLVALAGLRGDRFGERIRPGVDAEIAAAKAAEANGEPVASFRHLERAHVLGQSSTAQHIRAHLHMLAWAARRHDAREVTGQILRVVGAAAGTWAKLVPQGNTGGSNVSGFKSMPIPKDLADQIAAARASHQRPKVRTDLS